MTVVVGSAVAFGVAIGAGLAVREPDPWPPKWYMNATKNQEVHLATWKRLRSRAVDPADVDFPPSPPKRELMRFTAVSVSSDPGDSRPTGARVYFSDLLSANNVINGGSVLAGGASVYVLALRGKFSTADLRHPPGVPERPGTPEWSPTVIILLDAATMDSMGGYQGREVDLSPLGETIELDLDTPLSRG